MQPTSTVVPMDPYAMYGAVQQQQEVYTPPRKAITAEPSKEKEPSNQYSPRPTSSSPRERETSPKVTDFKKRKRGRPPLEKDSRSCTNCGTSETPEWRKGPLGPHTLCNACGLQWMKAQKRENELKAKYDEARKRNSLHLVLNNGGHSTNVNQLNLRDPRGNALVDMGSDSSSNGELSSRYSPEMDTLPADAVSPTLNSSPMQSVPTPITMDTLNTLKAIQTINALSHMNHMNHVNTLNHLNILSTNPCEPSLSSPHYSSQPHTVINHYNSNLNTYTSNSYNLAAELSAPLARYPPLNPQQVFLPMNYSPMMNSPSQAYSSPYLHQGIKDYTHPLNVHTSPSTPNHHNTSLLTPPLSHSPHPHTPHHSHSNHHSSPHSHHLLQVHVHNPLLHPSSTLIPNPQALSADDSVTGGGQM